MVGSTMDMRICGYLKTWSILAIWSSSLPSKNANPTASVWPNETTKPSRVVKGGDSQQRISPDSKMGEEGFHKPCGWTRVPLTEGQPQEESFRKPCRSAWPPKSESTRTATVCFISIYLPWRPAQGNISKNTDGMTENSNTIFRQQIQEKYEKLHEECVILCLVISINTFYVSLGTFLMTTHQNS